MKINLLDKAVADKIAAGEVIERPVSIIKELVENSIDAGADSIVCEIKKGGKTYIRVTDNGSGIESSEIEKAFLRHATSKITGVEDLGNLRTLGFRGEALASIAAVTRMEVITRSKGDKVGTRIIIHGGDIISKSMIGCPEGTTMVIKDLFYNTPARLKFMKSEASETGRITEFLSNIAVGFPGISFRYSVNGKIVFTTSGDGNLENSVYRVYNHQDFRNLIPISGEIPGLKVTGYISKPSISRNSRKYQIYLVNGRIVESSAIDRGVQRGYRERLFEGRFPITFILLNINPMDIDVNIHPNKKIIKFDQEQNVIDFISETIYKSLTTPESVPRPAIEMERIQRALDKNEILNLSPDIDRFENLMTSESFNSEEGVLLQEGGNNEDAQYNHMVQESPLDITGSEQVTLRDILRSEDDTATEDYEYLEKIKDFDLEPGAVMFSWDEIRPLGIVFSTYILCTDDKYFYMIDQHAAHERVYYEKLVGNYLKQGFSGKTTQLLAIGTVLDLTHREMDMIDTWKKILESLGFEIDIFGPSSVIIKGIPDFMSIEEGKNFAAELIENLDTTDIFNNKIAIDKLITKSCKSAIKAHDYLTSEEIVGLLSSLKKCRNPYSCPHGRPTIVKFTQYELERMFKRA